ncbi:MAG: hypothetical protein R3E53_05435 [Myxococcota bacterium]
MAGAAAAGSPDGRVDAMRALDACADVLEQDVSEAQREIFDRFYGDGAAVREIAREVGKSKQAVKIGLFRTRRAMESRLAESADAERLACRPVGQDRAEATARGPSRS